MKDIIQQINNEMVEKFYERVNKNEYSNLDMFTESLLEDCKEMTLKMVGSFLEEMNLLIREDKKNRKVYGLKIKEKDRKRELLTPIRQVRFKRDYYYNECNDEYVYPLDKIIELEGYERLTKGTSARLLNEASEMSYEKSAREISRQTVKNKLMEAKLSLKEPPEKKRKAKEIHIFADEDHVHMQRPRKEKGKKNKIVPLITISEGIEEVSRTRNKLKVPMHFASIEMTTVNLWEEVSAYIEMAYEN